MISITSIVTFLVGFNVIAAISWDAFFVEPGRTLFPLDFRLRRIENWLPMGIVYCGFYTARYNMAAANVPSLIEESRMVDSSIPLALSLGFWSYAVTAPWTGMYADRVGGRQAMLLATFGSTLCNLVAAALAWIPSWTGATRTVLILFFYTINVVFQGFGTSAVVKINAMWYNAKERGSFSGVFNVLVTSGYFTSLSTGSWVAKRFGFPALFLLPSVLLTTGGVFILTWVQNRPETTWAGMSGFKSLPKSKLDDETDPLVEMKGEGARSYDSINHGNDRDDDTKHCNDSANDDKLSSFQKLSSDAVFLCYCGAVFFLSFVRDGLLSWIFSFLEYRRKEELSIDLTSMLGAGITIGGFLGGVTCGVMSDLIFKGSRIQPILVFTTGTPLIGSMTVCSLILNTVYSLH
jgi:OPA family glycerol-3-phosphate transporter-like MFS transporter